jgi:hypothetical protein
MLVAGLVWVTRYGSNVPSWDGWDMVPTLTRHQSVTLDWLWSQHNEHRVPLPRLLLLGLNAAWIDFRIPMVFDVLLLGGLAAAMIIVADRLRGGVRVTDAFFPLVLLHWGQAPNLLWAWQVQFFSSTALAIVVLLLMLESGAGLRVRTAAFAAGICILLLPLCGANGVALVPGLVLWLLYLAALRWRSADPALRRVARGYAALGVAALLLVMLYFVGWEPVPWHPHSSGVLASLQTALQFLTIGLGPATREAWPVSGIIVLLILLASVALLVYTWRTRPEERERSAGLLCFLAAMASLALGLGMGRDGFEIRYVTLAAPVWCAVYLAWRRYGPGRWRNAAPTLLFAVSVALLIPNTVRGVEYSRDLRGGLGAFEHDLTAGVPPFQLIARYGAYLHPHPDLVGDYLPMLHDAGVGTFQLLRSDPPFVEVPIPLMPSELNEVGWRGRTARVTGAHAYLVFTLREPVRACGIRLTYRHSNATGRLPYVGIAWRGGDEEFTREHYQKYSPTGDHANWLRGSWTRLGDPATTMTVWGCRDVAAIRIDPDFAPGTLVISKLTLLVPTGRP